MRIRIDPMVAIGECERHYQILTEDLLNVLTPSRITLGCLRGLVSTMARAVDRSWISYLSEESSWGRKPPTEIRFRLYANIMDYLQEKGYENTQVGVCKDTLDIWGMLKEHYGLDYRKIKCNCIL